MMNYVINMLQILLIKTHLTLKMFWTGMMKKNGGSVANPGG